MVNCKYYQQGNCRYGQYCQYKHVNNFVNNKAEFNEDDIALTVAKEVLLAERGEQWLLSCFGPLRERPCIPGMEDLSPEEVRWEMYEAQKTGMVEQAKLHFQQLCQDMKAKREALKNPTQETILMLKKILGSSQKGGSNANSNTAGKSSTFFAASQLGLANNTSTNNLFANKTYNVPNNNPFGGGGFTSSSNAASIFGKTNNNSAPVFGRTATFGNNLGGFGTTTNNTGSIFGGNTSTSFSGMQNNASAFGASQNNSVFGGSSQTMFAQGNNIFGGTNQLGNTSSASLFNPMISQANTSLFGGVTTTAASLFGTNSTSTSLQTNSVFGTSTTSSSSVNNGIFNQPKTQVPAFGGAPIFGGVNYANNTGNSIFGGSQTFGASASGIFGGSTAAVTPAFGVSAAAAATSAFDLNQQSNNNTFGAAAPTSNVFGGQNINTAVNNSAPFGAPGATISGPFASTNSQQLDSTGAGPTTQFVDAGFGMPVANSTFGTETSSNPIFANAGIFVTSNTTVANTSPFTTFGNVNASSPFGTTTLTTTTPANPFAPRMQQGNTSSPFGNVPQSHLGATGSSSPFGKSPFNATTNTDCVIDDSVYSAEDALTDDEKRAFLADEFILGQIPLKPPTKALR